MDAEFWQRVEDLFHRVLESPPDEREALLGQADDEALRAEVRSLLVADESLAGRTLLGGENAAPLPEPPRQIGEYEILDTLGIGGMGVVYLAHDPRLDRRLALKFLPLHLSDSADARRRLLVEAKAASRLDHPNICTIYDIGDTASGEVYLVMAYYEGTTLDDVVREGALPVARALGIALQVAAGLQHAHDMSILHRDIKPSNLILTRDEQVKILDFGIAKIAGVDITDTGTRVGTVAYMAPEQLRGEATDARADVWSLGVVLAEMLTGRKPFSGEQPHEVMYSILQGWREPSPELPPAVNAVLDRALAARADARYASVSDMAFDLARLLGQRAPAPSGTAPPTTAAERRQVSTLCCRPVRIDPAAAPDPEAMLAWLGHFRELGRNLAQRYDGTPVHSEEDCVVLHFGYPVAHEDDALRAVYAARELIDGAQAWRAGPDDPDLALGAGIYTGEVVADPTLSSEGISVVGANRAAAQQLQELARADDVVVAASTHRLIAGYFDCRALGAGAGREQRYRVVAPSGARSRLEASTDGGLSPLVGRAAELGLLAERWAQAVEGFGQGVLLAGEPGIGKSRLAHALRRHAADSGAHWCVEWQCTPHHGNSALYPVLDALRRHVLGNAGTGEAPALLQLQSWLRERGVESREQIALVSDALGFEVELPPLPSPQRRRLLHQTLRDIVVQHTEREPVLVVVEDLHWSDPSTLDFIGALLEETPARSLLVLLTARPEFTPPWPESDFFARLSVGRLPERDVRSLVSAHVRGGQLPEALLQALSKRSDGVPLYVEQLTNALLESGVLDAPGDTATLNEQNLDRLVPSTLKDLLAARLDRLGRSKPVAQLAAVLGREFEERVLRAVWQGEPEALDAGLQALTNAGLAHQRGSGERRRYLFKHALIRDAAYASLLHKTCRAHHQHVAEVLRREFTGFSAQHPEVVAHHFDAAGNWNEAVNYWTRAGQLAVQRSANPEAIEYFDRALARLSEQPESGSRDEKELGIRVALGAPMIAARGYAAPEVREVYARARSLCDELGGTPQMFRVQGGLAAYYLIRAELHTARTLQTACLGAAEKNGSVSEQTQANAWLGTIEFYLAHHEAAAQRLDVARALFAQHQHQIDTRLYGLHPEVLARTHLIWQHWLQGRADTGRALCLECIAFAEALEQPLSLAHALNFANVFFHFLRDWRAVRTNADRQIALATDYELPHYAAYARILRGWSLVEEGDLAGGLAQMLDGLDARRRSGAALAQPLFLGLIATAQGELGRDDEGLETLRAAHQVCRATGERWWQPELSRLQGEVIARRGGSAEQAGAHFRAAVARARAQNSPALALRALLSAARHGGGDTAAAELRAALRQFGEGHDTADLRAALAHT